MNRGKFIQQFEKELESMINIVKAKNSDYAKEWAFNNFELVEYLWVTSLEKWILVRMTDKISRISNLIDKEESVKDEKISDTLTDLSAYSLILKIYLNQKW